MRFCEQFAERKKFETSLFDCDPLRENTFSRLHFFDFCAVTNFMYKVFFFVNPHYLKYLQLSKSHDLKIFIVREMIPTILFQVVVDKLLGIKRVLIG